MGVFKMLGWVPVEFMDAEIENVQNSYAGQVDHWHRIACEYIDKYEAARKEANEMHWRYEQLRKGAPHE